MYLVFCLACVLCIEELVWKLSGILITNIVHSKICTLFTVSMSDFLNHLLQELLGLSPSMVFILTFHIESTLHVVFDEPQNIIP